MRNQRRQTTDNAPIVTVNTPASAANAANNQQNRQSENNLAVVLIGIVIMHLACHVLRVFLAILSVQLIGDTISCMQVVTDFCYLVVICCCIGITPVSSALIDL